VAAEKASKASAKVTSFLWMYEWRNRVRAQKAVEALLGAQGLQGGKSGWSRIKMQ
jgi:hypothetical protein